MNISILVRTVVYASLFIGVLLIYLPARLLSWSGIFRPAGIEVSQVIGKGTPAPFDPPQRLVMRGPYRFVRNPMYIGAGLTLAGAGLYYESFFLLSYAGVFLLVCHLFVIGYEEPTLRRTFGDEYEEYCRKVRRWWPVIRT